MRAHRRQLYPIPLAFDNEYQWQSILFLYWRRRRINMTKQKNLLAKSRVFPDKILTQAWFFFPVYSISNADQFLSPHCISYKPHHDLQQSVFFIQHFLSPYAISTFQIISASHNLLNDYCSILKTFHHCHQDVCASRKWRLQTMAIIKS